MKKLVSVLLLTFAFCFFSCKNKANGQPDAAPKDEAFSGAYPLPAFTEPTEGGLPFQKLCVDEDGAMLLSELDLWLHGEKDALSLGWKGEYYHSPWPGASQEIVLSRLDGFAPAKQAAGQDGRSLRGVIEWNSFFYGVSLGENDTWLVECLGTAPRAYEGAVPWEDFCASARQCHSRYRGDCTSGGSPAKLFYLDL